MTLHSMKRTKMEKKEYGGEVAPAMVDEYDYPYGLSITLEKECLDKLNLDIDDFSIDSKAEIICKAEVSSLHENANKHNKSASVTFQITDMAMIVHPNDTPKTIKEILSVIKGAA